MRTVIEVPIYFLEIMFKNRTRIKYCFPIYAYFIYILLLFLLIGFGYVNANYDSKNGTKSLLLQRILTKNATFPPSKKIIPSEIVNNSTKLNKNSVTDLLSNIVHKFSFNKRNNRTGEINKNRKSNDHFERFLCLLAKMKNNSKERDDEDDSVMKHIKTNSDNEFSSFNIIDSIHLDEDPDIYYDDYASSVLPKGCEFLNHDVVTKTVICNGNEMTKVPFFLNVRSLDNLVFNSTGIQVLDRASIEGLPRVTNLVFMNGVLMRVSFIDLINYQPAMKNLTLIHNSITSLCFSNFYNTYQNDVLQVLDLRNNLITTLPEVPLRNETVLHNLKTLLLSENPVGAIPGDIFYPLRESAITSLYLREAGLSDFGAPLYAEGARSPLVYLKNLRFLDLSRNPQFVPEKLEGLLAPLTDGDLKELFLDDNSYLQVPKAALESVKNTLEILSMARSSLYCLDSSAFPEMPKLLELDLQFSRITQIRAGAFDPLIALQRLNLDGNILTTLPHAVSLPTLNVLTMNENPSDDYPSDDNFKVIKDSMNKSQNLEKLSMQKVPLKTISKYFFEDVSSLQFLDLSTCQISYIEDQSFRYLSKLTKLNLRNNKIKEITKSTFDGLYNLLNLDLSDNSLDFIKNSSAFFINYTYSWNINRSPRMRQVIDSDENETMNMEITREPPFYSVHVDVFQNTYNLKNLNLKNNNINFLQAEIFENLTNLKVLELSNNRIKIWSEAIFRNNGHLRFLNLRNNEISSLTEAMIDDLSRPDLVVDLRENMFICSCSLLAFENELNETFFVERNNYKCMNNTEFLRLDDYLADAVPCEDSQPIPDPGNDKVYKNIKLYVVLLAFIIISSTLTVASYRNRWYFKYLKYKVKFWYYVHSDRKLDSYEFDVFVCYSQYDRQWVFEKLVDKLESYDNGDGVLRVSAHERDFIVGEEIGFNIMRSVENSRKVIVVVSRAFINSTWCMYELQIASDKIMTDKKSKLIIIMLEPIPEDELPKVLKILTKTRTYISWTNDTNGEKVFWTRLLASVVKRSSHRESNSTSESSDQQQQSPATSTVSLSNVSSSETLEQTFHRKDIDEDSIDGFSTFKSRFSFKNDTEFGILNGFYFNEIDTDERLSDVEYIKFRNNCENERRISLTSRIELEDIDNSEV